MTRVLHLITSLDVGGAQRMLLKLLTRTDRAALPSRVVTLVSDGPMQADFEALGVEVRSLELRPGRVDPRGVARLRAELADFDPDVLQSWLYHADLLATLAVRRRARPRLVWNVRCSDQAEDGVKPLRRAVVWTLARLSNRPAAIVVNSSAGRASHAARGYRPLRWESIPNGFVLAARRDMIGRREARAELGLKDDDCVALTLARWHPSKGVDLLAECIAESATAPDGPVFLLAGEGLDPLNQELLQALAGVPHCARLQGPEAVRLLGLRRDVPRLLRAADFLISPSRFEGFPNVLGEALAAERACVATDAGDSALVVGEAGVIVQAGRRAPLAEGIAELVRLGRERRDELGRLGRQRIEASYSIESVTTRYEALYRELGRETTCAV